MQLGLSQNYPIDIGIQIIPRLNHDFCQAQGDIAFAFAFLDALTRIGGDGLDADSERADRCLITNAAVHHDARPAVLVTEFGEIVAD